MTEVPASRRPTLARARLLGVALTVGLALLAPTVLPTPAAAAETCTDTPAQGYTARVCLVAPDAGAVISGDVVVTARLEFVNPTVAVPALGRVVYHYRNTYLLTDYTPVSGTTDRFDFVWRTGRMVDGVGSFVVKVRLADGTVARHTVDLTLANGVTAAPVNGRTFEVRRGSSPAPGSRFRVVAVGDGAAGWPLEEVMAEQIASWQPNLFTYLGDVYERGSAVEFDNWYGLPGAQPRGLGRFRDITNPTPGNHEYLTLGATGYFDYWDNVPHYYSYDVAGWHIVSIDSNPQYGQVRPGTPQYEWLLADLSANRARCTLVYFHHPRISLGSHDDRKRMSALWNLLAARRVTLALAGHTHHYERWVPLDGAAQPNPRGVTQIVAGAGGHKITPPILSDGRVAAVSTEAGALRLDLGENDAQFAYVTASGAVRDSGTIGCASTGDPVPPAPPSGLRVAPTSDSTAVLSWQPTTDTYGAVASYVVRRGSTVVATLPADTTSFADSGLTGGSSYTWTVSAVDDSDNASDRSRPVVAVMPAPPAPTVASRALFRGLAVRKEKPRGYLRSKFRTWVDADGDGCNTRAEVLLLESRRTPTLRATCRISGRWFSALDGRSTTSRSAVGIEHAVPLAEAWQSGARAWSARSRQNLANDLAYRPSLDVATKRVLRARGSAEPMRWLPPRKAARCSYLTEWVATKWRWRLSVDKAERRFLGKRLRSCGWPAVERPVRAR